MTPRRVSSQVLGRRLLFGAVCLLAATLTSGCLDMEQSIVINKDLTGRAGFKMSMNLEPLLAQMVQMMGGAGAAAPPPEAMEQIKQGVMTQFSSGMIDVEALKGSLPAGVTVVEAVQKVDGMTMVLNFSFAYTDIRKLPEIAMKPRAGMGGAESKPIKPFEDLEFRDEGATLVIATKTPPPPVAGADPQADAAKAAGIASLADMLNEPGTKEMIAGLGDAIKGLRVAIRIETPLTVIEHNAPAKVGAAMVWEQKIDSLNPVPGAKPLDLKPMTVLVKIKK